ncbi:MAG: hypothetical protein HOV81_03115 [Kofleriaceae bacterium]|nr:hypothetical protein [Kofleriaceae bacterium]
MKRDRGAMFEEAWRAVLIGVGLGFANAIVIGCGVLPQIESSENNPAAQIAAIPASILSGACLGLLAHLMRAVRRWLRAAVLVQSATLVVYLLAEHFGMQEYAAWSYVPTIAAALLLERVTREKVATHLAVARTRRP